VAPQQQVLAIVGPTGTGKTALSLALAARLDAEIVNCDSRQVYRGLDIGSAKPTAAERAAAPHHLFDVVAPDESFDAATYGRLARAALAAIAARGRTVIVVGGTGLYLKALRFDLFAGPPRDETLRARLAAEEDATPGALHARLAAADPVSAARLHANDRLRLIRALEVLQLTGQPLSAWQAAHGFARQVVPMRVVGLRLSRAALYERLDRRCAAMLDAGLLDELRGLRARGYDASLPPMQSIGYRELGAHLDGGCDLPTALAAMRQATRRLAKRQMTWFRGDPTVEWVEADAAHLAEEIDRQGTKDTT
jgi:tRNA dimethylallyltransferase